MDDYLKTNLDLINSEASIRYDTLLASFNTVFKDTPVEIKQLVNHLRKKNIHNVKKRFTHSEYDLSSVVEERRKKLRVRLS